MNDLVKVFHHNDLDGEGVKVVATAYFGEENVVATRCTNESVNKDILNFISSGEYIHYHAIIVGDLSFNERVAETINHSENLRKKFIVVDHHKTALWLNKYPFCSIEVERDGLKASGTSSLFEVLYDLGYELQPKYNQYALKLFCEKVRRYDTWDWFNIYKDEKANMLNQLLFMQGYEEFHKSMNEKLTQSLQRFQSGEWEGLFTDAESTVLKSETKRMESYIDSKLKNVKLGEYEGSTYGFVFAEQFISQLGNAIANKLDSEIDFALIIDMDKNKVSLRSIGEFDVSLIAKKFNGGGHKNASGFYTSHDLEAIARECFEIGEVVPIGGESTLYKRFEKDNTERVTFKKLSLFKRLKILIDSFK